MVEVVCDKNLNLEDLLNAIQTWKQDEDEVVQRNIELHERLKGNKQQVKEKQEMDVSKHQEIDFLQASLKDLEQTIENLQGVEATNRDLKLELEQTIHKNEQAQQLHNERIRKFEASSEECRLRYEQHIEEQRNHFKEEMNTKEDKYLKLLNEQELSLAELKDQMSRMKLSFKEESLKMEAQHKLQVIKLEEQVARQQQKLATKQSVIDREIYQNKLQKLQEQFQSQVAAYKQQMELLKQQMDCEQHVNKDGPETALCHSGKAAPKFNRKRKLYKPIETLLQPSED